MEFELTEEQRALQEAVRAFASEELRPGAAQRDETGEFPLSEIGRLQRMGLFGLPFSRDYGGGGKDFVSFTIVVEELARADASIAITLLAHTLCAGHINAFGTEAQKRNYLAPLAGGGAARGVGAHRAGGRERRGGHPDGGRFRRGWVAAHRQQVLHLQRLTGGYPGGHGLHRSRRGSQGDLRLHRRG